MRKLFLISAVTFTTAFLCGSGGVPSSAFVTVGSTWSSPSAIRYLFLWDSSFSPTEETQIGTMNLKYDSSKTNVFNAADPGSSNLNISGLTITSSLTSFDNSKFKISRNTSNWPFSFSAVAVTCRITCYQTNEAGSNRAVIYLNDSSYDFGNSFSGSTYDLQTVILHELGHAHGLAHPADFKYPISAAEVASVMNANGTLKRSLTNDDIYGLEVLY